MTGDIGHAVFPGRILTARDMDIDVRRSMAFVYLVIPTISSKLERMEKTMMVFLHRHHLLLRGCQQETASESRKEPRVRKEGGAETRRWRTTRKRRRTSTMNMKEEF